MYTSYIGKKFLKWYNKEFQSSHTAEEFFDKFMFPLFYDSEKLFMHVQNSPFFQKSMNGGFKDKQIRIEAREELKNKLKAGKIDGSTYVGFAAAKPDATTAGQLTSNLFAPDLEEAYASWIGAACGIAVEQGYTFLIDEEKLMPHILDSWKQYRVALGDVRDLADKQLPTWNGVYMINYLNQDSDIPLPDPDSKSKRYIPVKWVDLVFALAQKFPNQVMNTFIYQMGQTNLTYGIIPVKLPEVTILLDLYDKYTASNDAIAGEHLANLYNTQFGFEAICQSGSIGVKQLKPASLIHEMDRARNKKRKKLSKEEIKINYHLFTIWITAMINKPNVMEITEVVAKELIQFRKSGPGITTKRQTLVDNLPKAKSKPEFLRYLSAIINSDTQFTKTSKDLVNLVDELPYESFRYLVELLNYHIIYFDNIKEIKEND